jgi:DNA-binding MarR family transcriptional regulator
MPISMQRAAGPAMLPSTSKKRRAGPPAQDCDIRPRCVGLRDHRAVSLRDPHILAFSEIEANRAGLSIQQYQALMAIRDFSISAPVSIGDLARYMLIRHHTAVELVDRMVKLKIIGRSVDPSDRRRVLLELTREGERRLRPLYQIHVHELRTMARR